MYSLLLRTMARVLTPVILLFSVFVFVRGHQESGGGFVGGLAAAAGLVLWILSRPPRDARQRFPVRPATLAAVGLALAASAASLPPILGRPMLTSMWAHIPLPGGGYYDLGTTTVFDLGVYLVVVGTVLGFVFTLELRPEQLEEAD